MISVIIPALNEAQNLPGVLAALAGDGVEAEIIVVDGGSADGTPDVARRAGVRVIETAPGRGGQLRAGAEAAAGDVLWFLHADSRVPAGALIAVADELAAAPEAVGGNFRLLFDGDDEFSRWLDDFYARIRAKGVYYGDSGVFVRRSTYEALGGIPGVDRVEALGEGRFVLFPKDGAAIVERVSERVRERGLEVTELHVEAGRLDEVFRAITTAAQSPGAGGGR